MNAVLVDESGRIRLIGVMLFSVVPCVIVYPRRELVALCLDNKVNILEQLSEILLVRNVASSIKRVDILVELESFLSIFPFLFFLIFLLILFKLGQTNSATL